MNNKGFSLIELLAVIALIAIVLLIFTPSISKMIQKFRDEDKIQMLESSAISAAKEYVVDGGLLASSVTCGSSNVILVQSDDPSVTTLVSEKYLSSDNYYIGKQINVTYDCTNKKFTNYEFK